MPILTKPTKATDTGHLAASQALIDRYNAMRWATDYATIQAAVDVGPGRVVVPPGTYNLDAAILLNQPVELYLEAATLNGPANDYAVKITANRASVTGCAGAKIVVNGLGGIQSTDAHNVTLRGLEIDMNNKAKAKGIYHLGGWYMHVEDVIIPKTGTAADAVSLQVECTNEGAGNRGAYVSLYQNVMCQRVNIIGANPRTVTTLTFINLDCSWFYASLARCLTLVQPVIQQTGGIHITLRAVHGFTAIGGDFEGSGTIYDIDASSQGVRSINNLYSGFTGTYRAGGGPGAGGVFEDYSENV